jgi:phosphonate transport system substrate-binding protein
VTIDRRQAGVAVLALLALERASAQAAPIRLGLAPYLSPAVLLAAFRPVREHLERALGQPVEMVTARDFVALADATRRGDFELALVPAHLARLAFTDWGWHPLARTVANSEVLVLVREGGTVRTPSDLRGQRIGMLDRHSLTAAAAVQWLRTRKPALQGQVEIVSMPSINNALYALALDEVQAVFAARSQLSALPAQTPAGHRVLATATEIPGPWYIGRRGTAPATLSRWRTALFAFVPNEQAPPTASNSRPTPLSVADTRAVARYAAYLRRQLASPKR